jgi:hypothetical protein
MSTISWKRPVLVLFAAGIIAACSSSSSPGTSTDAGNKCGNGKIDTGEECDTDLFNGKDCSTETMGADTAGQLTCDSNCQIVTTDCSAAASTGGTTGSGGAGGTLGSGGAATGGTTAGTGGKASTGGTTAGTGGKASTGGKSSTDGGPDSGPADAGKDAK